MINPNDHIYARSLKEFRLKSGDKQMVFAGRLGISQQDYSKLERGKKHFTEELITAICCFLKITKEEFIGINNKQLLNTAGHAVSHAATERESMYLMKLTEALEDKIALCKIIDLFKTRYILEQQIKLNDALLKAKEASLAEKDYIKVY